MAERKLATEWEYEAYQDQDTELFEKMSNRKIPARMKFARPFGK